MQEPQFIQETFASVAPRYDLANRVLSGGLDCWWRRCAARMVARWQPARILDLATGSGDLALALQRHCRGAVVVGADFCAPMLEKARRKGVRELVLADGMALPFDASSFDVVTVAFGLRNMASWDGALREMHRVLCGHGHVLVLDFSLPHEPLRPLYRFYLHRCLPWLAGVLTGQRRAYEYLARSIEAFPSGPQMVARIEAAGFDDAQWRPLTGGVVSIYSAQRR